MFQRYRKSPIESTFVLGRRNVKSNVALGAPDSVMHHVESKPVPAFLDGWLEDSNNSIWFENMRLNADRF